MVFRQKKVKGYVYLQVVENRWEAGKTRQRVLGTLGRLGQLRESGQLDGLLESGARFAQSMLPLSQQRRGELASASARRIGAPMASSGCGSKTDATSVVTTRSM